MTEIEDAFMPWLPVESKGGKAVVSVGDMRSGKSTLPQEILATFVSNGTTPPGTAEGELEHD